MVPVSSRDRFELTGSYQGGTPDILGTARHVINDWNHQKIPYFTTPPVIHSSSIPTTVNGVVVPGAENVGQARIVAGFGKEFDFGMADQGAFGGEQDDMLVEDNAKDIYMDEVG